MEGVLMGSTQDNNIQDSPYVWIQERGHKQEVCQSKNLHHGLRKAKEATIPKTLFGTGTTLCLPKGTSHWNLQTKASAVCRKLETGLDHTESKHLVRSTFQGRGNLNVWTGLVRVQNLFWPSGIVRQLMQTKAGTMLKLKKQYAKMLLPTKTEYRNELLF